MERWPELKATSASVALPMSGALADPGAPYESTQVVHDSSMALPGARERVRAVKQETTDPSRRPPRGRFRMTASVYPYLLRSDNLAPADISARIFFHIADPGSSGWYVKAFSVIS